MPAIFKEKKKKKAAYFPEAGIEMVHNHWFSKIKMSVCLACEYTT